MVIAADRYYQIERQILVGRARGAFSEAWEDELLEESDELWLMLTPAERNEVDARMRRYVAADAPPSLNLQDRVVAKGDTILPRMAA